MAILSFIGAHDALQSFIRDSLIAQENTLSEFPAKAQVLILSPLETLSCKDKSACSSGFPPEDETTQLIQSLPEAQYPLQKLLFLSSAEVYGEGDFICGDCGPIANAQRDKDAVGYFRWEVNCPICSEPLMPQPIVESSQSSPISEAGQKLACYEALLREIQPALDYPVLVLRLFKPYWPDKSFVESSAGGVLARLCASLMSDQPAEIFEDGNQLRDFTHGLDLIQAINLAIQYPANDYSVYNIGSGERISILELIARLQEFLCKTEVDFTVTESYREGDVRHRFADISLAKSKLGYTPEFGIISGLQTFSVQILSGLTLAGQEKS